MILTCSLILCSRYLVSIGGRGDNYLSLLCDSLLQLFSFYWIEG